MKPQGAGKRSCKTCIHLAYDMKDGYYCEKLKVWLEQDQQCQAKRCKECKEK